VHVRSAAVGLGYALDPDSTAAAFVDGGFLTGDLGALDADGRLFLSGRVSQFINVAGRKVNVDEVERILTSMPGVVQARVVDVPCATRGQALVACVVLDDPAPTALEMRAYCARRLSPHKIPRDIVPVAALPVDARGKIDRRALAELAATRARV
jgi:acyl-CoA synthetase (AMP-forming)/AMP-acid ligase II